MEACSMPLIIHEFLWHTTVTHAPSLHFLWIRAHNVLRSCISFMILSIYVIAQSDFDSPCPERLWIQLAHKHQRLQLTLTLADY